MTNILHNATYTLDVNSVTAYQEMIENQWDFNLYSVKREYIIKTSADDILTYFVEKYPGVKYRVFHGRRAFIHHTEDGFSVTVTGNFLDSSRIVNQRFDEEIAFAGKREVVIDLVKAFDYDFRSKIVADYQNVDLVTQGNHGLEYITLPIKSDQTFFPEMYPVLGEDPHTYIDRFLTSKANILILIGDAGLGKSALINEIILRAKKPTQIVYDTNVMKMDTLYTNFINRALREEGGLMIMEDSDTILTDRVIHNNDNMARLLNLSDGIVDTSGAKFIFSANLKQKEDIDSALIRPGRCFDIVTFRNLSYDEALVAADAIGVELYDENKDSYTVAEIFNKTNNRKEVIKKQPVGFGFTS